MNDRPREHASAQSDAVVQRDVSDGVATLLLNRPRQYNALSRAMLDALVEGREARVLLNINIIACWCLGVETTYWFRSPDR